MQPKRHLVQLRKLSRWILPTLNDDSVADENLRRRIFISYLSLIGAPLVFWFSWLEYPNLTSGEPDWFMFPLLMVGSLLLSAVFFCLRKGYVEVFLSRLTLGYFVIVAFSQILLDRGEHSLFYFLILPLVAVFVLGLREGVVWGLVILVSTLILLDPVTGFDLVNTRTATVDFIGAFLVVMSFSLGYESLRVRAQRVADERTRKLRTERKRLIGMQKEILSREDKLRQYAAMASDWLLETDEDFKLVYVSSRFERVTGIRLEEVVGQSIFRLIERYHSCDQQLLCQKFEEHEIFRDFRYSIQGRGGKTIHVVSRGEPVFDSDGCFSGYLCTNSDMSEYVEFQEEIRSKDRTLHHVQKLDAIGQLTSGVAHDFNNLLTVIKGNLEFMRLGADGNWDLESVNAIESAADQASDLTSKLLSFSKQRPMETDAVEPGSALAELSTLIRHSIGEKMELEVIVSPEVRPCLVDRSQLDSAVLNLVLNARDAMDGEGRLVITAKNHIVRADDADLTPGNYVKVSVIDGGKGMAPNVVDKVTEPFFTTKPLGEGTGLGLSMVYGFVSQSGGKLQIESAEGIGTNMSMILPQALTQQSREEEHDEKTHSAGDCRLALMVEDEVSVQKIVGRMLRLMGYETMICSTAEEALVVLQDYRPNLVLTDMMLGTGMNGMSLADRVTDLYPETLILLMSGYPEEILDQREADESQYELLRKPFGYKELSRTLHHLSAPEAVS